MKAEIELSINPNNGEPIIKIKHFDKDSSDEQVLLGIFLEKATTRGMELWEIREIGSKEVKREFEIRIKE